MTNKNQVLVALAAILILTVVIGHPLMTRAQLGGHSAYVDLIRSIAWHAQVEQGEFYPRWIPDFYLGHGSPIFLFYAPASYIFVEMLRGITDTASGAIKLALLLLIFFALAGMYLFGKTIGGHLGGLASAVVLGFSPYFLLDLYVRNGIAEFACFAVLPWLLWSLVVAAKTGNSLFLLSFSAFFALLVCTHNITSMISAPIILVFALILSSQKTILPTATAYTAGMGLSAWFWLPAIVEKNLVQSTESLTGGFFHYANHFIHFLQLFSPKWGWGSSAPGPNDGMSLQVGLLIWAVVSLTTILGIKRFKLLEQTQKRLLALLLGTFGVCLLFTMKSSSFFWDHLPLLPFVQFPWRFLLLVVIAGSALAAFVPLFVKMDTGKEKFALLATGMIVLLAFGGSIRYVKARYVLHDVKTNKIAFFTDRSEMFEADRQSGILVQPEQVFSIRNIRGMGATTTSKDDYLPAIVETTKSGGSYYGFLVQPKVGQVTIADKSLIGSEIRFSYTAPKAVTVGCEPFYFPGWEATLRDEKLQVRPDPENGWILLDLPKGEGDVILRFGDTPIRTAGKAISLITLLAMGMWLTIRKDDTRRKE